MNRSRRFEEQWNDDRSDHYDDEGPDGDDDFDYEEFVENEFGDRRAQWAHSRFVRYTTIVILIAIVFGLLLQFA